jgi:hypothetical protein
VAQGHSAQAGQALLSRPMAEAIGSPRQPGTAKARPARAHRVWARSERHGDEPAHRRWGLGEVCGKTIYEVWPSCYYTKTGEGRLGRGSSPVVNSGRWRTATSMKETSMKMGGGDSWARSFSCKGRRST